MIYFMGILSGILISYILRDKKVLRDEYRYFKGEEDGQAE